ncbi:hypothetical protein [Thiobacillus sp.]
MGINISKFRGEIKVRCSLDKCLPYVLILSVLLTGCASTQKLSEQDKKRIEVVKLNTKVERPKDMYYFGPGASVGLLFGAVGGAIAGVSNMGPGSAMLAFAEQNGVRIEEIVSQEFEGALRQSGKLKIADRAGDNGATINLSVIQFGFSVPNGFSSRLVPVVSFKSEMVDAGGNVIWSARDSVLPLGNPVEGEPADALRTNAKAIEAAWRAAVKHIARNMVSEL